MQFRRLFLASLLLVFGAVLMQTRRAVPTRTDHMRPTQPSGPRLVAAGSTTLTKSDGRSRDVASKTMPLAMAQSEEVTVTLGRCHGPGCRVTLTFSRPMVSAKQLSDAPAPDVHFDPPLEGAWRWLAPTQASFTPIEGALNWGMEVAMSLERFNPIGEPASTLSPPWTGTFRVPFLEIAGKVASWPVVKGEPRLVAPLNDRLGRLGRGALVLLYDQPVAVDAVRESLSVSNADGEPLAYEISRPRSLRHVQVDEIDSAHLAAIRLVELPEEGEPVFFSHSRSVAGGFHQDEDTLGDQFQVDTEFRLTRHEFSRRSQGEGRQDRVPLTTTLHLEFSDPFRTALLEDAIQVEPEPRAMHVVGSASLEARVRLELEPGTRYRLTAAPAFVDVLGNPLERDLDIGFHSEDLEPELSLPTESLLVEHSRPLLPVRGRNIGSPHARVWSFESVTDFIEAQRLMRRSRENACEDYGLTSRGREIETARVSTKLNLTENFTLSLDDSVGLLCVELRARGRGSRAAGSVQDAVLVQSSTLAITTKVFEDSMLVWLTRLEDASVIAGGHVQVFAADGTRIASGTTDAAGIVVIETPGLLSATSAEASVYVVAEVESAGGIAIAQITNERLSQAWHFGLKGPVEGVQALRAAVFTERGVYRPSEIVHGKIIVAASDDGADSVGETVQLEVHDPRGQRLVEQTLALDAFRTAAFEVPLDEQAGVGGYSVRIRAGEHVAERRFQVEEYRVPTFEVRLTSPSPWDDEDEVDATISARYHHGGDLVGRRVDWRVLATPRSFSPKGFSGYVFHREPPRSTTTIGSGEAHLDERGRAEVSFTPGRHNGFGPVGYTIDANVTDVDRQSYAGRLSRVVHPTSFYLGLGRPPNKVVAAGAALTIPVLAMDPQGNSLEGIAVELRVEQLAHHTIARLQTSSGGDKVERVDHTVSTTEQACRVQTSQIPVECRLRLGRPGAYRIVANAKDGDSKPVTTSFDLISSGDQPAPWPRFSHERIVVASDREDYQPGDVARLVIQSPFDNARALLTVERDSVIDTRMIEIHGDTPVIELPITDDYAPNVFVSVVLVRGRVHGEQDAIGFETGAPGFRLGYASLNVQPSSRLLHVQIESASNAEPKQTLPVRIQARDHLGRPVRGQATLMVVDEAVLGLTGYQTPNPGKQIYAPRPLGVRTAESRLELAHSRRARHEQLFPGGDGGGGDLLTPLPAELRNLFESTAYWDPDVLLDEDGAAEVEVALPDNVTTFRIMAVVTDVDTRVGSSETRVVVKKPLMVQPVLPRFVYPEDRLTLEGLVFNGTEAAGDVQLVAEFEGLELVELDASPEFNGAAPAAAHSVASGGSTSFPFDVRVTARDVAKVRFHAKLGSHTDSVEVELPVLSPGTRRTLVTSTTVTGEETLELSIPSERLAGTTRVDLVASTTALSELEGALDYLMRYPNGCIEQTTSTAYPLVTLKHLLPEIGVTVDEAKLEEYTLAGLKRILSFQTTSGGLSYWPGKNEPHAFATAFGLTALIEAKKQGYDISDESLSRMADYLETVLRDGTITGTMPHGGMADGDTRALFIMTLGRLGRPQPAYLETLWDKRDELTPFGLSFLAIAAAEMESDHPLIEPILASVAQAAKQSSDEAWFDGERDGGWSFGSPLRTHASALIAFASDGRSGAMGAKLLEGLLSRRRGGMWGNTQENVFGIMGVHALTQQDRTSGAESAMSLAIDGWPVDPESFERPSGRVRRLRLTERELLLSDGEPRLVKASLARRSGPPIILTMRAEYDAPLTPQTRAAQSNGFAIERRYETLDGESLDNERESSIPLGALVRVRLRVTTTDPRHYVAIADKLPAGLEPLNTRLDTTESVVETQLGADYERSLALLSHTEMRDERVAFYVDDMPPGVYEFVYLARATTPGHYLRPAADVEAMYEPELRATTAIDAVRVR